MLALAKELKRDKAWELAGQITDAAISSTANIAEGFGRFHYQENIQFCRISRGSLHELMDHQSTALDEKHITDSDYGRYRAECELAIKLVNGYIRMLRTRKAASDQ